VGLNSNGKLLALPAIRVNGRAEHSSLLRYGNNYSSKKFYSTGTCSKITFLAINSFIGCLFIECQFIGCLFIECLFIGCLFIECLFIECPELI